MTDGANRQLTRLQKSDCEACKMADLTLCPSLIRAVHCVCQYNCREKRGRENTGVDCAANKNITAW